MSLPNISSASSRASQFLLSPTKTKNHGQWYRAVMDAADLGENSCAPGFMVIKPWAQGIWDQIRAQMDAIFTEREYSENYTFPVVIPLHLFEKEEEHAEGFAKEILVATAYRIMKDVQTRKFIPDPTALLPVAYAVRPTSELVICWSWRKWIQSYRDLPLRVNQWCSVVRMEREFIPFIRTSEFLWHEGHSAFATEQEARDTALTMAKFYEEFITQRLAVPLILGRKSPGERFAGAVDTFTVEGMTQNLRAIQAATSHYLGQNFSKAAEILFTDKDGERKHPHTGSYGCTTRLIGLMTMVHGDDEGARMPPDVAKHLISIIPMKGEKPDPNRDFISDDDIQAYISKIKNIFAKVMYNDRKVDIHVDKRQIDSIDKLWDWRKKGVPLIFEIGPNDVKKNNITVYRRDQPLNENGKLTKNFIHIDQIGSNVLNTLAEIRQKYYDQALAYRDKAIKTDIETLEDFIKHFSADDKTPEGDDINQEWVKAKWCGDPESEEMLKNLKRGNSDTRLGVTIRCLPLEQSGTEGTCVLTGKPATLDAIFAKSY